MDNFFTNLAALVPTFTRWEYAYGNHVEGMAKKKKAKFETFAAKYKAKTHETNLAKVRQAYRKSEMKKGSRKGKRVTLDSQIKCLTILCYYEQLIPEDYLDLRHALAAAYTVKKWWSEYSQAPEDYGAGKDKLPLTYTQADYAQACTFEDQVRKALNTRLREAIYELGEDLVCVGIEHNRDGVRNYGSVTELSKDKPHLHLMIYLRDDRASNFLSKRTAKRIKVLLKKLGISFLESDAYLLDAGALAPVSSSPENFTAYMVHQTPKSIADGKAPYEKSELITNLSDSDLQSLLSLYTGVSRKAKLKDSDWDALAAEAYKRGQALDDCETWLERVLTTKQQGMNTVRVLRQKYERGVRERLSGSKADLTRCSIIIHGEGGLGKSYASRHALEDLGMKTYKAVKGSGKYDGLKATDTAILFDDIFVSDARNIFENSVTPLYRRNSSLAVWSGKYAIVTTNLSPKKFILKTANLPSFEGHLSPDDEAIYAAISQRCYFATVGDDGKLLLEKPQTRGTLEDKQKHDDLFHSFATAFEKYSIPFAQSRAQQKQAEYEKEKAEYEKEKAEYEKEKAEYEKREGRRYPQIFMRKQWLEPDEPEVDYNDPSVLKALGYSGDPDLPF